MCHDSGVSIPLPAALRVALAVIAILGPLSACGGDSGSGEGGTAGSGDVVTQVSQIRVINPAMVAVDFTARNDGDSAASLECEVSVIDPDGTSEGSKSVSLPGVNPGATQPASVQVEVSDEGAEFVTQASVECGSR